MINSRTVLVLGAGASKPYGFPTGCELIHTICHRLTLELKQYRDILRAYDFQDKELHRFQFALLHSNLPSIDIFLENRPEYMRIGKVAIALALIPFEHSEVLVRNSELKWYEYLFSQMGTRRNEFESSASKLSVITFNYDRSLEYFLIDSLMHAYGGTEKDAIQSFKYLNIVHMYGELGKPAFLSADGRSFTPDVTRDAIDKCISEIRIMNEHTGDSGSNEARDLIKNAVTICFLGFGYHPRNVERLQIEKESLDRKRFIGTARGLKPNEIAEAARLFERNLKVLPQNTDADVLEFLRSWPAFQ